MELETIEAKSTQITSRLQRCDTEMAKETTSHASFRKYYSSIKARGRNPFSVRMELETIEAKSTQLTSRLQRCDPKKQRRQRPMLPLEKHYCYIKARSRHSFTFKIKLKKLETTSYEFNAEFTNICPTYGTGDNSCCFPWGNTLAT